MSSSSSSSKTDDQKSISQKNVPFPPRPNRFSCLSPENKSVLFTDVLQNKESKLVTSNISPIKTVSPFIKSPSSSPLETQRNFHSTKTPYIINPNIKRIQILEVSQISKLNQGFHILTDHLFGRGKTFYSNPYKTKEYYQTIRQEYSSICFTYRSTSSEGTIDYSKAQILKLMGLIPKCLPDKVLNGSLKFKELFVQPIPGYEYLLQFSMLFKIPWIMSWTYNYQEAKDISPPWLNYLYKIEWWEKFKLLQANSTKIIKYYEEIHHSTNAKTGEIKNAPLPDPKLVARILNGARSSQEELHYLLKDIPRSPIESNESAPKTQLLQEAQDPFDDQYEE
uniref:Uncharacterized protein n=1 Tax=Lactuca sativa TaxID=4236 RepID=A0A9R1VVG0_LACSA|nr:hypothetical protein LSAT_V11C400176380 [Lactuca sativa]